MDLDFLKKVNTVELGQRLAAARRQANFSQDLVAERLGVSRPTLVAIEKGIRLARPVEIAKMAEFYSVPIHELLNRPPASAELMTRFRVTGSAAIGEEILRASQSLVTKLYNDMRYLESLARGARPMPIYPEVYEAGRMSARAAAEQVATLERVRLGLGDGPIHDLADVLEHEARVNLFILPLEFGHGDFQIAGLFAHQSDLGPIILVNGKHPATRQRWTMAHEYGHFLKDRHEGEVTVLLKYDRKPYAEQFADGFAACFLMPSSGVRQRFRSIVQVEGDFTVADLCQLADQYGVSVESMARRLESLDCVARGTWDRLQNQYRVGTTAERTLLGLKVGQPERHRLPARFRRLAVEAYRAENITEGELMRLLRVSRVEAREIVDSHQLAFDVDESGDLLQLELPLEEKVPISAGERS